MLNTAGNMLTPGTIIHIQRFLPVYYRYEDNPQRKFAIVVREFKYVGRQELSEELKSRPAHRANPTPENRPKPRKQSKESKPRAKKKKPSPKEEQSATQPECNGNLCSCHGVEFVMCITDCIKPGSITLAIVAQECVFVTRDLEEMSESDKRFLLYYYYATTVYQFHGKGNRIKLPECLKYAIRQLYPNNQQMEEDCEWNWLILFYINY